MSDAKLIALPLDGVLKIRRNSTVLGFSRIKSDHIYSRRQSELPQEREVNHLSKIFRVSQVLFLAYIIANSAKSFACIRSRIIRSWIASKHSS